MVAKIQIMVESRGQLYSAARQKQTYIIILHYPLHDGFTRVCTRRENKIHTAYRVNRIIYYYHIPRRDECIKSAVETHIII